MGRLAVHRSLRSIVPLAVVLHAGLASTGCKKSDEGGTGSTTTTTTSTSTTTTSDVGGGGSSGVGGAGGTGGYAPCDVVAGGEAVADGTGDCCDSVSTNNCSYMADHIDLTSETVTRTSCSSQEQVDALYNRPDSEHGCQDINDGILHICTTNYLGIHTTEVATFDGQYLGPVPQADTGHSLIYSVVFDSDGDPANDWIYQPPYDWDYFQGADRWYQVIWDRIAQTWSMRVTQVNAQQGTMDVDSAARAEIEGSHVRVYIPEDEIPNGSYRFCGFGHNNFSQADRGGDVSGANPTVPLKKVP